jgi:hypothetical protein
MLKIKVDCHLGGPMGRGRICGKFDLLGSCSSQQTTSNQTYAPDYLNGDALPTGGNVTAWAVNHGEAQTTPPLLAVISALKSHGIKQIATTGYCFGGEFPHSPPSPN